LTDIPDPFPTPEAYEAYVREERENLKLQVEAQRKKRQDDRLKAIQEQNRIDNWSIEQKKQKRIELIQRQTYGMDKQQVAIYERLMDLQTLIEKAAGDEKEDLKAEWSILMQKMLSKGRIVGTSSFLPATVLLNVSGNGIIDNNGKYHSGVLGSYDTTSWTLEADPENKEQFFLVKLGVIEGTNIMIKDKIKVVILDKAPEIPRNHSPDLFPTPQKLPEARTLTKTETEKKRKGLFR
jgi:hypothetical protein